MNKFAKRMTAMSAAIAALASTAATAAPTPPPAELFFSQSAGFVNPTTDASAGTGYYAGSVWANFGMTGSPLSVPPYPTAQPTYAGMYWGSPFTTSNIAIGSFNSTTSNATFGGVENIVYGGNTNNKWEQGEFWVIDRLTQTNNVLPGGYPGTVWTADTLANLRIFDTGVYTPGTEVFNDLNSATRLSFAETKNTTTLGECTEPNISGSNPCNDIYTVLSASFAPLQFWYGDYIITLSFTLIPGSDGTVVCTSTSDPGCSAAVLTPGEIRVYTPENNPGTSNIMVAMAWDARIPEPSMIGLFGAGILGLGLAARRRRNKTAA